MQRPEKYDMFKQPEMYFNVSDDQNSTLKNKNSSIKIEMLNKVCAQDALNGSGFRAPEMKGQLYLRAEGKKTWKKLHFILKTSGLYYCPKGKPITTSTKDLQCLITFEMNCVYFGLGWKKKFKSPTDFGFAIKNPEIQTKSPKHIKYLCADSEDELRLWVNGIRMAKYGRTLVDNFERFRTVDNSNG